MCTRISVYLFVVPLVDASDHKTPAFRVSRVDLASTDARYRSMSFRNLNVCCVSSSNNSMQQHATARCSANVKVHRVLVVVPQKDSTLLHLRIYYQNTSYTTPNMIQTHRSHDIVCKISVPLPTRWSAFYCSHIVH